jgi:DNA-directed RNA polymerase alpha subunit
MNEELRTVQCKLTELIAAAREAMIKIEAVIGPSDLISLVDNLYDETPISALYLPVRAEHAFASEGIRTVGDLITWTDSELMRIPNFGKTSLAQVRQQLKNTWTEKSSSG